jgi:hypothetical protein
VTAGNDAPAIFAQSVGGGGGNAELDDSQVQDILTAPEIALDVLSDEKRSVNLTIGRQGGTGGEGGNVAVTSNGTIATLGDRAVGIRAQSVGNAAVSAARAPSPGAATTTSRCRSAAKVARADARMRRRSTLPAPSRPRAQMHTPFTLRAWAVVAASVER